MESLIVILEVNTLELDKIWTVFFQFKNTDTRTQKISNITKLAMDGRSPLYPHGKTLSTPQ